MSSMHEICNILLYRPLVFQLHQLTLKVVNNQCNVLSFLYWLLCFRSQAKATIGFSYDNSGGVGNSDKEDDDDDSDSDSVLSDIGKKLFVIFEHHYLFDYGQRNCWW